MLHAPFLVPLADRAKETVKQIMAAEDQKGILLVTAVARQNFFDGRGQIIVAEAVRNALERVKGVDMPVKKGFLFLGGIGADEQLARIAQAHDEDLDGLLATLHDHVRLAPIDLGVGARIKLQRQEQRGFVLVAPKVGEKGADIGLGAAIALGPEALKHGMAGLALFGREVSVLGEHGGDAVTEGAEDGGAAGSGQGIDRSLGGSQCGVDGFARDMEVAGNLPNALVFDMVGSSDLFTSFHGDHAPPRYRSTKKRGLYKQYPRQLGRAGCQVARVNPSKAGHGANEFRE